MSVCTWINGYMESYMGGGDAGWGEGGALHVVAYYCELQYGTEIGLNHNTWMILKDDP